MVFGIVYFILYCIVDVVLFFLFYLFVMIYIVVCYKFYEEALAHFNIKNLGGKISTCS